MQSRIIKGAALAITLTAAGTARADAFDYAVSFDVSGVTEELSEGTYLKFMEEKVKPAMDQLATEGYPMCDRQTVAEAYEGSNPKVQRKVDKNFGGLETVLDIVDKLEKRLDGENVTLATLPKEIRAVAPSASVYDLANFLGMACGGGVKVVYAEDNYALNVHYDVTEERSGRSYGVGPTRGANDASDKDYLDALESYSRESTENLGAFYTVLFRTLLATDPTAYGEIEAEGQTVMTDFLAVYTAEQARNLMDGHISQHWDAALLEVTLTAGFHAGQSKMKLFYKNPATGKVTFTDKTLRQKACAAPASPKAASLNDYWQFSRNITDPSNCKRSGINITKSEFRKLGTAITKYVKANHPAVYAKVKKSLGLSSSPTNLYNALSQFLISESAPREIDADQVDAITEAYVEFLAVVTEEADAISATLQ